MKPPATRPRLRPLAKGSGSRRAPLSRTRWQPNAPRKEGMPVQLRRQRRCRTNTRPPCTLRDKPHRRRQPGLPRLLSRNRLPHHLPGCQWSPRPRRRTLSPPRRLLRQPPRLRSPWHPLQDPLLLLRRNPLDRPQSPLSPARPRCQARSRGKIPRPYIQKVLRQSLEQMSSSSATTAGRLELTTPTARKRW